MLNSSDNDSLLLQESLSPNGSLPTTNLPDGYFPKTLAYAVLFLVTVVGNSLILLAIRRDNRLKTTNNFLVANMAASDLLSNIFLVPTNLWRLYLGNRWLIEGDFGSMVCKLVLFIPDTSTAVSFYSCLFIAIDRYLAVARPLRGGFSKTRLKVIIPGIWFISALMVSPYFYSFTLQTSKGSSYVAFDAQVHKVHHYVLSCLNFGIPVPIIATLYGMIIYKLRHHKAPGNPTDIAIRRRQLQNRKVLKMSITIVSLLYLSWGYFALMILLVNEAKIPELKNNPDWLFSGSFVVSSSFTYNFFILLFFNGIYRENFQSLITSICCRCRSHSANQIIPTIFKMTSITNLTLNTRKYEVN